jgi:hypothetical protein
MSSEIEALRSTVRAGRVRGRVQAHPVLEHPGAGYEMVQHRNAHELKAWLQRAERRGEVSRVSPVQMNRGGGAAVLVLRHKRTPGRVRRYAPWVGGAVLLLAGVSIALWSIRDLIVHAVGITAAVLALCTLAANRANHSGACPGVLVHCAGCRR